MFQTKVHEKIKTRFIFSVFSQNRAVFEIVRKNTVQPDWL